MYPLGVKLAGQPVVAVDHKLVPIIDADTRSLLQRCVSKAQR